MAVGTTDPLRVSAAAAVVVAVALRQRIIDASLRQRNIVPVALRQRIIKKSILNCRFSPCWHSSKKVKFALSAVADWPRL